MGKHISGRIITESVARYGGGEDPRPHLGASVKVGGEPVANLREADGVRHRDVVPRRDRDVDGVDERVRPPLANEPVHHTQRAAFI